MPLNITADTPRNSRMIAGITVQVPAPYAEGHTITAGEAAMLNQTLAENFSNNLRKKVEAEPDKAQALVDEYAGVYEPGVRRSGGGGGRTTLDPIEKEMKVIARESLNGLLKKQGLRRNEVDYDTLLDQVLTDHEDALRAKAEKIVAARNKNSLDDLDVSIIANSNAPATEATAAE